MQTLKDLAMLKTKISKTGATLEKAKVKSADSQFTGKLEAKMVRRMSSEVRMQTESEFSIYCTERDAFFFLVHLIGYSWLGVLVPSLEVAALVLLILC